MLILRRKLWEKKSGGQSVIKWEHKVSFQCHLNFLTIAREIMQIHKYKHTQILINISNNSFDACQINLVHVTFVRTPLKFFLQTESKSILKTTKLIQFQLAKFDHCFEFYFCMPSVFAFMSTNKSLIGGLILASLATSYLQLVPFLSALVVPLQQLIGF